MCDVLVRSRPPFYLQIQQEFHFLPDFLVTIGITRLRIGVDDTFVKDEAILFYAWNHFNTFFVPNPFENNKALPHWWFGDDPMGSPIRLRYCLSWSENSGQLRREHSR